MKNSLYNKFDLFIKRHKDEIAPFCFVLFALGGTIGLVVFLISLPEDEKKDVPAVEIVANESKSDTTIADPYPHKYRIECQDGVYEVNVPEDSHYALSDSGTTITILDKDRKLLHYYRNVVAIYRE